MTNENNLLNQQLDEEEQILSTSLDKGEWQSIDTINEEITLAKEAAANYFRKDARINIRISKSDLEHLRQKAAYKGLPYQTLIASILHEYAAGHFDSKI